MTDLVPLLSRTRDVLDHALAQRACSACTAEVGRASGPLWAFAGGRLSFDPASAQVSPSTIFDLASLTKVLATTTLTLTLASRGQIDIDAPVREVIPEWRSADRTQVTIRDLLEHCSGLPPYREYFRRLQGRDAYLRAIADEPLEYATRSDARYSDLGFILLGVVLERAAGAPLDAQFTRWREATRLTVPLDYQPSPEWASRTAMTEDDPWRGRMLQGEVHDENAAALGGVAAHAGLFGTVAAVGDAARWWLRLLLGEDDLETGVSASAARAFVQPSAVPGSSRALGWDTMRLTSSCGTRLSPQAVGHTGFTGTSLWIDPTRDLYCVLLTNRVHPTRTNEAIGPLRRAFHDAVAADLSDAL